MKKYVLVIAASFLFLVGISQATHADVATKSQSTNTPHLVRRPFTASEMTDFQDIMGLAVSTAYDANYQYVYEAVYPGKTQRIRASLTQAQQSLQAYEQTGSLNELDLSAISLYDVLDDMYSGYTIYRVVFNDYAYPTRFGSLQSCINRVLELESVI